MFWKPHFTRALFTFCPARIYDTFRFFFATFTQVYSPKNSFCRILRLLRYITTYLKQFYHLLFFQVFFSCLTAYIQRRAFSLSSKCEGDAFSTAAFIRSTKSDPGDIRRDSAEDVSVFFFFALDRNGRGRLGKSGSLYSWIVLHDCCGISKNCTNFFVARPQGHMRIQL